MKKTMKEENEMNDTISYDKELIENFLGAFPAEFMKLSREQQQISTQIYKSLAEGNPISIENLSSSVGLDQEFVKNITDEWPGVFYDDDSRIIGYWGLTTQEMGHRFKVDGNTTYTWCAWDALFIPQIIGKTAEVESGDPVTKNTIKLTVTPTDGISNVTPSEAVVSFLFPETAEVMADVIGSFCHYVHFFESNSSAKEWISENEKKEELLILPIDEAYSIGLRKNELQLGDILETA